MKNVCKSRRCYPINDEDTNIYLCNFYDANLYSKLYSNDDNEYYIKYNDIYEYMIFCEEYATFYINKKEGYKEYDITNDFLCPSKSTIVYCYILIYLFIFVSLFCSSILLQKLITIIIIYKMIMSFKIIIKLILLLWRKIIKIWLITCKMVKE